jgi:CHAT domain-containing protein
LVKQQAPGTKTLHLAAHGIFNPDSPLDSLIALAPDNENDGWLTVGEVYGLDLHNASLVVLSACDTQMGQLTAGDEFVGLTRALFFAGAPTVVASLWSVDDEATSLLMEHFYAYLRDGMGKGEALRQAQADIREQYPNPYYWAAFVLNGDSSSVIIETDTETPTPAFTPSSTQITPAAQTAPSPSPRRLPSCGNGLLLLLCAMGVLRLSSRRRSS